MIPMVLGIDNALACQLEGEDGWRPDTPLVRDTEPNDDLER